MGSEAAEGFVLIIFGLIFVIFHRDVGSSAMACQRKVWGIRGTESQVRMVQVAYFIAGVATVVIGILAWVGVIDFGPPG